MPQSTDSLRSSGVLAIQKAVMWSLHTPIARGKELTEHTKAISQLDLSHSMKVFALYRMLGMNWQSFRALASEHGLHLQSPNQVLLPEELQSLALALSYQSPEDEDELLMRLRGVLSALPEVSALDEMERLLASCPDVDSRRTALHYCQTHIDTTRATWPKRPFRFDWEHIAPTAAFWRALRALAEGEPNSLEPEDMLADVELYFALREGGDPSLAPKRLLEGHWAWFYDAFDCEDAIQMWKETLFILGFWDAPAHYARCWSWVDEWQASPDLDTWSALQRLSRIWSAEPTRLVPFALQERAVHWDSCFRNDTERFVRDLSGICEYIHSYLEYEGIRCWLSHGPVEGEPLLRELRGEGTFFSRVLAPKLKQRLMADVMADERANWTLTLDPQEDSLLKHMQMGLLGCLRRVPSGVKKANMRAAIQAGFQLPGLVAYRVQSNRALTCCGSGVYLLETSLGITCLQLYQFC